MSEEKFHNLNNKVGEHSIKIAELENIMKDIKDDIPQYSAKKWDESYHSINHFIGKVKELEKKIGKLEDRQTKFDLIRYKEINNEIAELKKKLEKTIQFTINHVELQLLLNKYYPKEIAELREKVEGIYKSVHGIEPDQPDKIWEQLNELKERIFGKEDAVIKKLRDMGVSEIPLSRLIIANILRVHATEVNNDSLREVLRRLFTRQMLKHLPGTADHEWAKNCFKKLDGEGKEEDCEKCTAYVAKGGGCVRTKCYKDSKKGKKEFLNPHLQCNGECHECEDNIPSINDAPNQCGRLRKNSGQEKKKVYVPSNIDLEDIEEVDVFKEADIRASLRGEMPIPEILKKTSGGEKSGGECTLHGSSPALNRERVEVSQMDASTDSKPPEPKCPICNSIRINTHIKRNEIGIKKEVDYPCQCQNEKREEPDLTSLNYHFEKEEPRENEYQQFVQAYEGYWKKKYDEAVSEFVNEKKELEKDLRKKWKRSGYWVHVEKQNHIKSLNNTYQGYLMAIHIWRMYRVDYYSKRSGRRNSNDR